MNLPVVSNIAKRMPKAVLKVNRKKLVLKKNAPHIFFGLGVAGSVASTVLACRATLKLSDALETIEYDMSNIRNEDGNVEASRDTAYVYGKSAVSLVKLYAPALAVGTLSIAALSGSHIEMSRRNTSLMAAYAAVSNAFDAYRQRVEAEYGVDKELDLYRAKVQIANGASAEEVEAGYVLDADGRSPYARLFDETSPHWEKNTEYNRLYIQCQQTYLNHRLQSVGHVFLNEAYDALGFERTSAGAVVGWVLGGKGDDFIDFGMFDCPNPQFINGVEPRVWLDFNVDGVIYDLI